MKPNEQTRAFLKSLSRQHLSGNTVKAYENAIMRYYRHFDRLSPSNLLGFQALLTAQYRPQTANLSIIGINKYLTYLGKPDWRLPVQRIQHCGFLENVITLDEYQQMLDFTSRICATKYYCIIRTLALTGARVSELKQFRIEHIRQGYLDIVSKGYKMRRIYLPDPLCRDLQQWCESEHRDFGPLFLGRKGQPMTERGIAKALEMVARACGINPKVAHPHSFRHMFAKNFISRKCDLALLADILGHESLETTKIYLRCTSEEQKSLINDIVSW